MAAGEAAALFVGLTFFPRLTWWLRWKYRLRGRRMMAYIGFDWALRFAVTAGVRGMLERLEAVRDELRDELGREPTEEEVFTAYGARRDD